MSQQHVTQKPNVTDDEIDLRGLFAAIWQGKWIIIAITAVFAVAAVFYALSLPNIYKSEALLAPASEQKSPGLPGQLGGLAALAGVNLGSGAGVDKTVLAIEILKSRDFIGRFIQKHDLLVELMAVKDWNISKAEFTYDSELFDTSSGKWVRDVSPPKNVVPSYQEAHSAFRKIMKVSQDNDTGMIKLSIEHYSPDLARDIVRDLITDINFEMRQRDIEEAKRSIVFIQKEINETKLADVKASLFSLIEEQTKTLMLANVRDEYAFRIVDPALVPEEKFGPKRAVIVIMIVLFSSFISMLVLVIISLRKKL